MSNLVNELIEVRHSHLVLIGESWLERVTSDPGEPSGQPSFMTIGSSSPTGWKKTRWQICPNQVLSNDLGYTSGLDSPVTGLQSGLVTQNLIRTYLHVGVRWSLL